MIKNKGERDLFHVPVSDKKINAVIDAQIFFHLHDSDNDHAVISKGLRADFLDDLVQLYITDEMLVEIDRSPSDRRRSTSRSNAHSFPRVDHDLEKMTGFSSGLTQILPERTESQKSDIKQLAKTAASDVKIFLTLDKKLLRAANEIQEAVGVRVLSPMQIIAQLAELTDPVSYTPTPLSGSDLMQRKFDHDHLSDLNINQFLVPSERKNRFQRLLNESLSRPTLWNTYGIWLEDELVAIRSTSIPSKSSQMIVNLYRESCSPKHKLFIRFVIASILYDAVRDSNVEKVFIHNHSIVPDTVDDLKDLGFAKTPDGFVRLCPSKVMSHNSLQKMLCDMGCKEFEFEEIEKMCPPVALKDSFLNCFLIPIKPGYARGLFDTNLAKDDLFSAEPDALLGWSNVYYRRKSHHHMLKAPARILWYESGPNYRVVAVSHLDAVMYGSPKKMFHQHQHMGTLSWSDIYNMCQGAAVQDIMVLRFSHTYLFNHPVGLDDLRALYRKHGSEFFPLSPRRVPKALFLDIFQKGYERMQLP